MLINSKLSFPFALVLTLFALFVIEFGPPAAATTAPNANEIVIRDFSFQPATLTLMDRITLNEALGQLSPGYRAVFILHDLEGYEHHQISVILGCAVGTSKSQLHKARLKLRRLLSRRSSRRTGGHSVPPLQLLFSGRVR